MSFEKKSAKNLAQPIFCQKYLHKFYYGLKVAQNFRLLLFIYKNAQSKNCPIDEKFAQSGHTGAMPTTF
jgi:hypothetical protein